MLNQNWGIYITVSSTPPPRLTAEEAGGRLDESEVEKTAEKQHLLGMRRPFHHKLMTTVIACIRLGSQSKYQYGWERGS